MMSVGKQAAQSPFTQQISIGGVECTLSCAQCSNFAVHRSFVEYLLNDIITVVIVHT
jgi:predicted metal-binding protein